MSKQDEIMLRLYHCCLNATGAYHALEPLQHILPGYDRCKADLESAITTYENFKKEKRDGN